jgi:hypothetical protein
MELCSERKRLQLIVLMMEAASTFETSVNFYQAQKTAIFFFNSFIMHFIARGSSASGCIVMFSLVGAEKRSSPYKYSCEGEADHGTKYCRLQAFSN